MARDNGMMNVLLIAGGGFALYYILNNYGPAGAVYNSSGQAVNPSYWDTWFGPSSSSTVNAAAAGSVTATLGSPSATSGNQFMVPYTITGPANANVTVSGGMFTSPTVIGTLNAQGMLLGSFGLSNTSATLTISVGNASTTVNLPMAPTSLVAQAVTNTPATSLPASVTPVSVAYPVPVASGGGNTVYALMSSAASTNAFIQSTGGQADPYQWATLWNSAGQPAINVGSLFTPAQLAVGTPNAPGMSTQGIPLMSLTQFLSTLQSAGIQPNSAYGLSGMGNIVTLPSFNGGRGGFSGGFRGGFRGKPVVN